MCGYPKYHSFKKKKKKKKGRGENGNKLEVNEIAFRLLLGFLVEPSRVYGPRLLVYMAFVFGWCSYTVLFVELLLAAPDIKHTYIYIGRWLSPGRAHGAGMALSRVVFTFVLFVEHPYCSGTWGVSY